MKLLKPKIVIIEHNSVNTELKNNELKKSKMSYSSAIVQTKKGYIKALHTFKPDIRFTNYTFPDFDESSAFKIQEGIPPLIPFIFVSKSIDKEIAVKSIKK